METEIKGTDIYRYIELLETGKKFMKMMNKYRCAIMEVETKLKVLNAEFSLQYDRNPFESIKSRLKSPVSIMEKLRRKGLPINEEVLEQQIEDLTDRLKRNMAEFDNFRKRTEKEKSSMYVIGAKDIIEKILPVVDNFERGLAQAPEDDPFAEGMQKIYKQFTTTMEGMGVEPIEAVGKEFNPDFHNAVMHVEDEELGENVVAEEFQKGYMYRDSVVRHSMVKVAN